MLRDLGLRRSGARLPDGEDLTIAYHLTEWTALKDQDAEICHLIDEEDVDHEEIIATFSNTELGARLAAAALALANEGA